jgi:hypothetical protein
MYLNYSTLSIEKGFVAANMLLKMAYKIVLPVLYCAHAKKFSWVALIF